MAVQKINVPGQARLPAFCHATIADGWVYVSGTVGTKPGSMELVEGGTGPETTQTLQNIGRILEACGVTWNDVVKVNVFLADIEKFGEMNEAYIAILGDDPPARITVGKAGFGIDAAVEIDCIAYKG